MVNTAPRQFRDVDQPFDPTQVHKSAKRAKIGDTALTHVSRPYLGQQVDSVLFFIRNDPL